MDNESIKSEGKEEHRGIALFIDSEEAGIKDPAIQQSPTVWSGANEISFKLLRCLEAIRDITKMAEVMAALDNPLLDKRWAKQLASPLYNLASGVRDMFNELAGNAKNYSTLIPEQHKELQRRSKQFAEQVPIDNKSDLRAVRDKISSHIDKDAVVTPDEYWDKVDLLSYLNWIKNCLEQLLHLLALNIYGWTRESGHPDVWSLMSVDGTVVDLYMQNGQPIAVLNITLVKSPKYGVFNEIKSLVDLYNAIAVKCKGLEAIEITQVK